MLLYGGCIYNIKFVHTNYILNEIWMYVGIVIAFSMYKCYVLLYGCYIYIFI